MGRRRVVRLSKTPAWQGGAGDTDAAVRRRVRTWATGTAGGAEPDALRILPVDSQHTFCNVYLAQPEQVAGWRTAARQLGKLALDDRASRDLIFVADQ